MFFETGSVRSRISGLQATNTSWDPSETRVSRLASSVRMMASPHPSVDSNTIPRSTLLPVGAKLRPDKGPHISGYLSLTWYRRPDVCFGSAILEPLKKVSHARSEARLRSKLWNSTPPNALPIDGAGI